MNARWRALARCVGIAVGMSLGGFCLTSCSSGQSGFVGQVTAVGCASNSHCIALGLGWTGHSSSGLLTGSYTYVLTSHNGGQTWISRDHLPANMGSNELSCWAESSCVTSGVFGLGTVGLTMNGGQSWSQIHIPQRLSYGASCPASDRCFVLGWTVGQAPTFDVTADFGKMWNVLPLPSQIAKPLSLWCADATHCVVEGETPSDGGRTFEPVLVMTVDAGTTWSTSPLPRDVVNVLGGACTDSQHCEASAVVNEGHLLGHASVLLTTDGGLSWSVVTPRGARAVGLACATSLRCVIPGSYGVLVSVDGGRTWTSKRLGIDTPVAVSCERAGPCFVAGGNFRGSLTAAIYKSNDQLSRWQQVWAAYH